MSPASWVWEGPTDTGEHQEKIAKIIEELYRSGKILGFRGWREISPSKVIKGGY